MNSTSTSIEAANRPLLILDLDETLIFGSEVELERRADFMVGPYYVYQRPHLNEFLTLVAKSYDLAIWSSATLDYVGAIASRIRSPEIEWRFIWARERCTQRMDFDRADVDYLKDLKKVKRLGYDLNRILFIDDTPAKLSRNFGNAIYVLSYIGAAKDGELLLLSKYLNSIRHKVNFRTLEKRGWRSRVSGIQPSSESDLPRSS